MGRLRNWHHEMFACEIAVGTDIKKAYVSAGFEPSSVESRNYNRLLKRPEVAARVAELKKEIHNRARAAGMPATVVLDVLKGCGIERVEEFFEPDGEGALRGRDLATIPAEAAIALLRFLHDSLGVRPALLDQCWPKGPLPPERIVE
jgi:hypothetical protein